MALQMEQQLTMDAAVAELQRGMESFQKAQFDLENAGGGGGGAVPAAAPLKPAKRPRADSVPAGVAVPGMSFIKQVEAMEKVIGRKPAGGHNPVQRLILLEREFDVVPNPNSSLLERIAAIAALFPAADAMEE
jgi:hypothetical protein